MSTNPASIVDAIDAAILVMAAGGGAQTLTHEGRSVTYYSMEQLIAARKAFEQLTSATTDNERRLVRTRTSHAP